MAATKYLDHGLYAAWSATPGAGVCQEGDGSAIGAATVATVAIDLTAYTAAAGNTVTIGGALLTCVASGAGANQFNAGSGATLAANLASAINQTTNTNTITTTGASNPLLGWVASKLQDLLYATSSGATLNIQTRAGSAAFNSTSFFAVVSSGLTGGTLNNQFTGGAGGAWGYLVNHLATFGRSAFGIGQYGCWGANKPMAGLMDLGDRVKVRSAKTLQFAGNTNTTITLAAMGSATQPVMFEIDDGTVWPADGTTPVFKMACTWTGNNSNIMFAGLTTTYAHIRGKRYASGQRNLVMEGSATGTSLAGFQVFIGNTPMTWEALLMDCPGNSLTSTCISVLAVKTGTNAQVRTRLVGCRQVYARDNNSGSAAFVYANVNGSAYYSLEAHDFVVNDCTTAMTQVLLPSAGGSNIVAKFSDCKFIGFTSTSTLLASGNIVAGGDLSFRNCDFGLIKNRGPNLATAGSNLINVDCFTAETKYGARDFFVDRRNGFCEWNSAKGYPTASARLYDGTTPWSIYAIPANSSAMLSKSSPFELPAINKINTLATADRTVTLNMAIESTLSWTLGDISFMVTYLDSTGAQRYVDSLDPSNTASLTADTTSTWSSESGGFVTYSGQNFTKKQISLTCPDMASGCEVSIYVRMHTAVANTTLGTLIDPELKVI
jgi:hypothetical protein